MSALAKRYAAEVVGLLQEEPEPVGWEELHVGAERTHAGAIDTRTAEALGVAGGSTGGLGSAVFKQVPNCL